MRNITEDDRHRFHIDPNEALERVRVALGFLWAEKIRSSHDTIAGDFDYEELIAALLSAERGLADAASANDPDPA